MEEEFQPFLEQPSIGYFQRLRGSFPFFKRGLPIEHPSHSPEYCFPACNMFPGDKYFVVERRGYLSLVEDDIGQNFNTRLLDRSEVKLAFSEK